MNLQTIVYDEDKEYAKSLVMDLCNTEAVTACREGDSLVELEAFEEMMKEGEKAAQYHTGTSLLAYMKVMHKLCKDAIIERNEKGA